jgi:hypothetical protein
MELLGEQKEHYGKLRLWGAVGWGLSAPIIGWLIKGHGIQWSFWGYLIQMVVVFIVVMNLPVGHASLGGRYWQGLRGLLQDMRWRLFLLVVFSAESALRCFRITCSDERLGQHDPAGRALTVATIGELPILYSRR